MSKRKMLENRHPPAVEDRRAALEAESQKERLARSDKAAAEIRVALAKHDCVLVGVPAFVPGPGGIYVVKARVEVLAK